MYLVAVTSTMLIKENFGNDVGVTNEVLSKSNEVGVTNSLQVFGIKSYENVINIIYIKNILHLV